jgi:two-component system nitrate/nitrite response regulator NarL
MVTKTPAYEAHEDTRLELDRAALVVDRHRLFAEVVTPLLEDLDFSVAVATTYETAEEFISKHRPKLALVDLSLPVEDGFTLGRHALAVQPDAIVIGITPMADPRRVRESRRAGFWGCLSKDIPVARFTSHLRAAVDGKPVLQSREGIQPRRGANYSRPPDLLAAQLTSRELEVLALLVQGAGSSQIAHDLDISWNTVRTHAQSILTKLQVHSRLEAAAVAVQQGLVPDPTASATGAA